MQQIFDEINDTDEDKEYLARREKRRQRRLEAQKRRQKKLRIIKSCLGLTVIAIVVVVAVTGISSIKESSSEQEQDRLAQNQQETVTDTERTDTEIDAENIEVNVETTDTEDHTFAAPFQSFKFEETADTKGIYSEEVISENAILVDADTDTIIGKKGAYDRIIPASMTKVLTALVAAEAITEKDLDDTFTMTLEITDYAYKNDCSSVGFLDGEIVTVRDLFYGTILASGGDAAVGLATYVSGSHEAFVERMNDKVEQLGLADSAHFTNCVGIYDENLYCSAYDMAVIMKAAMQNELCREILGARTYTTTATTEHPEGITISNWFLRRIEDKDTGGEIIGGKTGYVVQSGSCAVSYQECEDGSSYICVTGDSTSSWRCIYDHVEIYNSYIQ